jgi:hypothetical protein
MKKIILILTAIVLLLLGVLFLINWLNNQPDNNVDEIRSKPTGIILPTSELSPNKLDIVRIDPKDQIINVELNKEITITFTKKFTADELEFFLTPNTPHEIRIEDNKLIVTPATSWDTGTLYTYFFNFKDDPEQVRLYRFTTTGPTPEYAPDTETEGLYEAVMNEQKMKYPDTYVTNNTPYESNTFSVTADFDPNTPAHNYFVVKKKIDNEEQVRQDVNVWLQQLDLSTEQIESLDIRYE